ncbi:MAG: zinc ribbon domain-containing protein [Tepidisphaeraceae bacterium]|jgi:putative FmdB family regulatory protein
MPTYQYKCEACGFEFEKFQSIKAPAVKKCPQCGKSQVKRLIGMGSGVIFKGGGFYATDYRSESYKSAAKADAGGTSGSSQAKPAGGGDGDSASKPSGDSKPAAPAKSAADAKNSPASTSKDAKTGK